MEQAPITTSFRVTTEDLLVGFCGFITSALTTVILWWIETVSGYAIYTWMYWFVIPVGAGLSGFAGASGYYGGSWFFGHRPSRLLLLNIVLVSVTTFFLIHYLSYISLEFEGKRVSDYIPFTQYLDFVIRSASYEFRATRAAVKVGSTGELGAMGYVAALLQIVGFAAGGFVLYSVLASKPYCTKCSQYLSSKGKQVRYTGDTEGLQSAVKQIFLDVASSHVVKAIESQASFGNPKHQKNDHLRSVFEVRHCKKCGQHWVRFCVEKQSGDNWEEIPELTVGGFTDEVVSITSEASRPATSVSPPALEGKPAPPSGPVRFRCWSCKADIEAPAERRGENVKCPACGKKQEAPLWGVRRQRKWDCEVRCGNLQVAQAVRP
jgi:DNA-directed RNA polymerase subunit RPC12/RpoP